jgi:hypothetical protein
MVLAELGTLTKPGAKKPPKVSPFNSLVMVVMLRVSFDLAYHVDAS